MSNHHLKSSECFIRTIERNNLISGLAIWFKQSGDHVVDARRKFYISFKLRPNKNICVFQVCRPFLGFCLDPKHFIVNYEQNMLKKIVENVVKMQFLYKLF